MGGIGAYLNRLGQRIIQMKQGPMLLTGYGALNKLLGHEVYTSQDQLGGPQVMYPNGCTHEVVDDDQEGVQSIIQWLSYVPATTDALPAVRESADPVNRDVEWKPTPTPYDPHSREAILPQAGQVLFPDSSYKTAQALRDFNNEGLPVMIFANWRGFSGGSRNMSGEILKFGAMIVDALREYEHPIYIYFPPYGELRGGSWVVVDPTINEEKMTMFSAPRSSR